MKLRVNLATQRPVEGIALQRLCRILVGALGLWLVINLAGLALVSHRHREIAARLAATPAEVSGDAAETAALRAEAERAERILQRRAFQWSQVLNHLERTWLEGIQVRSIEPDFEKRTLALQVLAKDETAFREYLGSLLEYEAFSEVLLLRQENTDIRDAAGRSMAAVRCELRIRGGF